MSASSKSVVAAGAFDDMRSRDIRFLEQSSRLGSLTVLLLNDDAIRRRTGRAPKFPEAERLYFLQAIRYVNAVRLMPADVTDDALPQVSGLNPAIWVVRAAENNAAKKSFCQSSGLEYRVIADDELRGFPDANKPAPDSKAKRKKVLVTGCYDWFHSGHVRFFEEASTHGDLYVAVGHDANVRLLKGEGRPLFPQEERRYVVGSIRFVKQALVSTGNGWLDAEPEIERLRPEIYAVNEDGDVPEKRDYCAAHGIEYLVLKRTPAPGLPKRSSTELRGF
jgi:cytidyltransferase-like protein